MITIPLTKYDGSPLKTEQVALTTRLAEVYRRPEDNMAGFMTEVKALSHEDKVDFAAWFNAAGYPTHAPALAA